MSWQDVLLMDWPINLCGVPDKPNGPNRIHGFVKWGVKRSNNNEKGVNKIENQGENWYKLYQKCQMTDFCEKIELL